MERGLLGLAVGESRTPSDGCTLYTASAVLLPPKQHPNQLDPLLLLLLLSMLALLPASSCCDLPRTWIDPCWSRGGEGTAGGGGLVSAAITLIMLAAAFAAAASIEADACRPPLPGPLNAAPASLPGDRDAAVARELGENTSFGDGKLDRFPSPPLLPAFVGDARGLIVGRERCC